ncbi:hypothetical protein POM88_047988 [Heracleum sosnowskyi]|uniref:Uncharacterized protein n=1 Tax=Heracleum sosnowskyi TaxID=360622 RepID=A0AAD8GUV6_9APIA|nr:hypothetical protein POM88_047988 [Heracleum sosnowskyi]
MSFGSQLQTLDLRQCTGIKHLGCQFSYNSNLSQLIIDSEDQFSWRWSVGNGRVIRRNAANSLKYYPIYLYKLLGNIPRIHFLCLDGYFFKFLEPDWAILIRPITTMDNLRTLHLVRVGFHDLVQVQYVLCLIRSSPNLQRLSIKLVRTLTNLYNQHLSHV